ncbi:hypothetical protein LF817_06120 [Halobacillus sp. A1]|uniref:Uncharacterized protein n=1 Tax=Halobacillus campisalis TaxID=435909 RepID=A0ABW2JZV1_9BACI|nr:MULTISPECIES: hypothetical protein [Halobacillus]MCP3030916.1 hypothetical protein [Halobacillus sp. A1]
MSLNKKVLLSLIAFSIVVAIFLIGTHSYFNYKIINYASDRCYEEGGVPDVEQSFLAWNYSFNCDIS